MRNSRSMRSNGFTSNLLIPVLDDAKEKIETWRMEYNQYRPHSSLDDLTPEEFYQQHQKAGNLEFTGV